MRLQGWLRLLLWRKVKNLEVKLSQARTQIERMSSAKLDEVLST